MRQKTFEICTKEDAARTAELLKSIPETANASCSLLKVFVFGFSYEETTEMISPIREAFPDMIVTGMTIYMVKPPQGGDDTIVFDETPTLRLGFFFFESSQVRLVKYEISKNDPEDMLISVRREIAETPDVKGVCVYVSGFALHVSRMLERLTEGFEDIPFFGTMADVYYISERHSEPFIFDNDQALTCGLIFLLYTGNELHVEMQYILGWKPIGKSMSITQSPQPLTVGDTIISKIDGSAPEHVYNKYLGIRFDDYLTINCCEFPLIVERDGLAIARTPFACTDNGEIIFIGSIKPDEKVRFSYTVRQDLIANTERSSHDMLRFSPEAVELFVCGNRAIMLRSDTDRETDCYRRFAPDTLHCSAAGEIYFHHGRGELLNSALVATGFREGEPHDLTMNKMSCDIIRYKNEGTLPLSERILKFLQSMSSDLLEYASEAQRANEAKSTFLANMSHDIRTPINAVLGMNEMILRETGSEQILKYASNIRSAGNTLLGLINDILDLSKIEAGKLDIIPVDYDLTSLLNDLVNMIQPRAAAKGLTFETEIDSDIPKLLHGDEIRIKEIITNILTNAVKYTEKGSVKFSVGFENTGEDTISLKISISDTGIGINENDIPKLFNKFDRIEEKRNRGIEGTGLGMNITQRLLELMNSKLDVRSEYGKGSVFSFNLGQRVVKWESVGNIDEALRRSAANMKKYREKFTAPDADVLVVDDTPMNLEVFESLLKKTLVRIDKAESGSECIALVSKKKYDIIFLDHMMPCKDGIETLKEMKAHTGSPNDDTPVICLTANAISGSREKYMNAGFDDYLTKPINPEKLEKMLIEYLPAEKVNLSGSDTSKASRSGVPAILVIDDDKIIRDAARSILKPYYRVICCGSDTEGIKAADKEHPDLILLDINLADRSGFDVLKQLKNADSTHDIPVMFITGENSEETEVNAFRCGASDYVRKPFIPEVLIQRSKRVIDLYHYQSGLKREVGRQTARADRLSLEMMIALSKTVDAKDHYTNGHSGRVAEYSAEIARRMGKSVAEQEKIYEMGLMHDIGKIGVSEEIINKPSRLTEEEFAQIKKHTVIGHDILSSIEEMPDLSVGARSHHEKYNGTGYPDGLKGKDIPEAARIICVADCYDAMTSTRTYSTTRPQENVRAEIERCSGTQFDPDIAAVMLRMIDDDTEYKMNEQGGASVWKNKDMLWSISAAQDVPDDNEYGSDTYESDDDEADAKLPEQLYNIKEINVNSGLMHCGTAGTYLSAVATYAGTAADTADEAERLLRDGDIHNATVKIHSLKSTSRVIGAMELGALAEELEAAGNANDTEKLNARSGELFARCRELGRQLSQLTKKDSLPMISDDELNEAYTLIREFLSVDDLESAMQIISGIEGYSFPDSEKHRCAALIKAAREYDYDAMRELTVK